MVSVNNRIYVRAPLNLHISVLLMVTTRINFYRLILLDTVSPYIFEILAFPAGTTAEFHGL